MSKNNSLWRFEVNEQKESHHPKITIVINNHSYHFEKEVLTPEDFRGAVGAPAEYEVWHIMKSPDPEGQLPVDDVQITNPTRIRNGDRFRVVPPGTFGR
jgi:hypothetical protein